MNTTDMSTIVALINREASLYMDRAETFTDPLKIITANVAAMELWNARVALEELVAGR